MGYIPWSKIDVWVTPPTNATKFTVFFSTTGRDDCSASRTCNGPHSYQLNIANVVLEDGTGIATTPAALLAQIAELEIEIARLQAQISELRSRL